MQDLQRIRGGGSRTGNGSEKWAPEGEGKGLEPDMTSRHIKAEYLRRDSCVSGKECDGTLQEVGLLDQTRWYRRLIPCP